MPGGRSSTPTATSTPTGSTTTPTRSLERRPVGRRGADPRPRLERRVLGARPGLRRPIRRGSMPPWASTRTTPRRSTTPAGTGSSAGPPDPRVVAIGETGLDYDRVFSPIADQLTNLRRNLALALETGKPAILHCRSSGGPARRPGRARRGAARGRRRRACLGRGLRRPAAGGHPLVLRSGRLRRARSSTWVWRSASPGSSFGRARRPRRRSPRLVPEDRLLVETDSPFLAPPGAPRSRNAPEWVRVTAAWLADRRGTTPPALGPVLVAAYDRTFPSARRAA